MMCSYWSRCRFVLFVAGALLALPTLSHAQQDKRLRSIDTRTTRVDTANGAVPPEGVGGVAGIGSACEGVGAWTLAPPLSGSSRFRGNAFTIGTDSNLVEIAFELLIADGSMADVEFAIYRKDTVTGGWVLVFNTTPPAFVGTGAPVMYRSGVIDPPVLLAAGDQYAIGVGWGNQGISYNQDLASYPQAFALGTIDGRVGRNNTSLPLPSEFLQLSINNNAYSMELCVTGACCLPAGTCIDTTEAACLAQGGQFSAAGVACSTVEPCPLPGGACCLNGGSCAFLNRFACEGLRGVWHKSVACNDPSEPCAPRGGCCLGDGSCLDNVTRTVCAAAAGTYRGDDVTCDTFPPCTAGACCTGQTCLLVLTKQDCDLSGGAFGGPGSSCADIPGPCDKTGACCQTDTCSNGSVSACVLLGGIYRGDGTDCATLPIACGKGACCVSGAGCLDSNGAGMSRSFCENNFGGTFSLGVSCDTIEPRCPGTCCADNQAGGRLCLSDTPPTLCLTKALGVFLGYTNVCSDVPNPCPNSLVPAGSCCVGDGQCVEVDSQTTCENDLRGLYTPGVLCAPGACAIVPTGACCDRNALACSDGVLQANCAGEWTQGAACSNLSPLCEPRGACCDASGVSCTNSTVESACVATGGTWTQGVLCVDLTPPCAPVGACCESNGASCSVTSEARCVAAGGVYRGDTTTCQDALVCNLGACCQRDGTCVDNVLDTECKADVGAPTPDFFAGRPCLDVCVARGACCVANECRITTRTECAIAGGAYSGEGTDCVSNFCVVGACCTTQVNNACQQLTRQACENLSGIYLGPNGVCDAAGTCDRGSCCAADGTCLGDTLQSACGTPDDFTAGGFCGSCRPRGACCLPSGGCQVTERLACLDRGGEYSGDATACEPNDLCSSGACCFQDATCTIDTRQGCEPAGGVFVGADTICAAGNICIGVGGCCRPDGSCDAGVTAITCNSTNGIFLGVGSDCADPAACTARGACCDESSGNCLNGVLQAECGAGVWSMGALCTGITCEAPGACCDPNNRTCTDGVIEADCTGVDTSWTALTACVQLNPPCVLAPTGSCCNNATHVCNDGVVAFHCGGPDDAWTEGVSCRNLDPACAAPETGACCDAGSCAIRTPADCAANNGIYRGADTVCDGGCDLGACCQLGGTCADNVLRTDCTQANATFTLGGTCDPVSCPVSGACCLSVCSPSTLADCQLTGGDFDSGVCCKAPVCSEGTPADCATRGGVYGGNGTACGVDFCAAGACCTGNSGCTKLSGPECEVNGDVFQGTGSRCDSGVCDAGCCCDVNGNTVNRVLATECSNPGDRFEQVSFCSDLSAPCQVRGACCLPNGPDPCQVLSAVDCNGFAGATYAGDGTLCEAGNLCEMGACCTAETCAVATRFDCAATGTYLGTGTVCSPADVCSIGGCCLANDSCHDLPRHECDSAGVFLGAAALCEPGACNLCDPSIVSSHPDSCLVDARYPHVPGDAATRLGWDSIALTLSCDPGSILPDDFLVTVTPNDVAVPNILDAVLDLTTVTITLDSVIPAGHWTCLTHVASGTIACLGSLPADVNSDRTAAPSDILTLIDDLNGISTPPLSVNQCDVDRSTVCGAPDILAVIDLLNGASGFNVWNGATLPPCPAAP